MVALRVKELESDVAEMRRLLGEAKREAVRCELQRVLGKLDAELTQAKAADAPEKTADAPVKTADAPAAASEAPAKAAKVVNKPAERQPSAGPWTELTTFALDLGGYDKGFVSVDLRMKGVELIPAENVTCDFTESSLDLKVIGLDGKNHRFIKSNLEKDIVPRESSVKVKKNHVIISLAKVKGQYGFDSWMDLCAKGRRKPTTTKTEANPQDSIMDMMKDLYDDGDDSMKKVIGEAMYKSRKGEKYDPSESDMKMPTDSLSGLDSM